MAKWKPCKRRDFIKKLRKLGFGPPEPGGRHSYMRHGSYTFTLPSNKEYSVAQVKMLLSEIQHATGKEISREEWQGL